MQIVKIKAEYIPQKPGMGGVWEKIEQGGRTCYKSEGLTKYDENGNSLSAEEFANKLVNVLKHRSVAEHATIYLKEPRRFEYANNIELEEEPGDLWVMTTNPYVKAVQDEDYLYVTTNYRVILENGWEELMEKYMCEPEEKHIKRHSIRIFTDRGVSAESNRHRVNSPSERSTRYCDYVPSKKWNKGIHVVMPDEFEGMEEEIENWDWQKAIEILYRPGKPKFAAIDFWMLANRTCEYCYNGLRELGWTPQQARRVLPLDIETELVITAFEDDWMNYFGQRFYGSTGTPHPDMLKTARAMMNAFRKNVPELIKKIEDKYGSETDKQG